MSLGKTLAEELSWEAVSTRKLLERVPADKKDWKPHPKSMSFGQLAAHVAEVPSWIAPTLATTEMDFNPPSGKKWEGLKFESTAQILAAFDKGVAEAKAALEKATDADLDVIWTMKDAGKTVMGMPRAQCLRSMVLSHLYHHRGQLTVYARINGIPLPAVYGPSADEKS